LVIVAAVPVAPVVQFAGTAAATPEIVEAALAPPAAPGTQGFAAAEVPGAAAAAAAFLWPKIDCRAAIWDVAVETAVLAPAGIF
jgi:hypothetical protein